MKLNIKASGIELTPAISAYVEKKLGSLEKYFDNSEDTVVQAEVGKSTKHHKSGQVFFAEVRISGPGLDLYAVSEQIDLYAAIDVVKDEVADKLSHVKGKRETLSRRGAKMVKDMLKGINIFKKRG